MRGRLTNRTFTDALLVSHQKPGEWKKNEFREKQFSVESVPASLDFCAPPPRPPHHHHHRPLFLVNSGGLWWHFKFVERLDFWSDDSITVHIVEVLLHFRATTADLTKMVVRLLLERL